MSLVLTKGYIKKYKFNVQINRDSEVSRKDEKVNKDIYHIKHEVILISMRCVLISLKTNLRLMQKGM